MPVLAILGGQDVIFDSRPSSAVWSETSPHAEIRFIPDAGHFIPRQTQAVLDFLGREVRVA